jgi:hypothetical protein
MQWHLHQRAPILFRHRVVALIAFEFTDRSITALVLFILKQVKVLNMVSSIF